MILVFSFQKKDMARTPSNMLALGTKAPTFTLPNILTDSELSFGQAKGQKGTVIVFMCNHCPFVVHVINEVVAIANESMPKGVNVVAINSNDVEKYPADSPELMKKFAKENNITFPYLFDTTQAVAKAYDAACTPDFYLFDSNDELIYRGQLDDSRPENGIPVSGRDVRAAIEALLSNSAVNTIQKPSIGCNIKWK